MGQKRWAWNREVREKSGDPTGASRKTGRCWLQPLPGLKVPSPSVGQQEEKQVSMVAVEGAQGGTCIIHGVLSGHRRPAQACLYNLTPQTLHGSQQPAVLSIGSQGWFMSKPPQSQRE